MQPSFLDAQQMAARARLRLQPHNTSEYQHRVSAGPSGLMPGAIPPPTRAAVIMQQQQAMQQQQVMPYAPAAYAPSAYAPSLYPPDMYQQLATPPPPYMPMALPLQPHLLPPGSPAAHEALRVEVVAPGQDDQTQTDLLALAHDATQTTPRA